MTTVRQKLELENNILQRKLQEATEQLEENQKKFLALEEDFMRAIKFMHKESA